MPVFRTGTGFLFGLLHHEFVDSLHHLHGQIALDRERFCARKIRDLSEKGRGAAKRNGEETFEGQYSRMHPGIKSRLPERTMVIWP